MTSSLRVKSTVLAVVVTAFAVLAGAIVLLVVLRQSLVSQIDDELFERSLDVLIGIEDFGVPDISVLPGDSATIAVVFDENDDVELMNDVAAQLVTGDEILAALPDGHLDEIEVLNDSDDVSDGAFTMRLPASDFQDTRTLGLFGTSEGAQYWVFLGRSLAPLDQTVGAIRNWALIAGPLLTALIGALTWLLTGRTLRRVDTMRAEVDEIAATTDLARRVRDPGGDDEISRLAATMNEMLTRLQLNDTRQQRFMSDAAHELRSPLASINAQIDVDLAHPNTADWPATAVSVRKDTSRLQRLIEDLLALARSEADTKALARLVDLDDVVFDQVRSVPRPDAVAVEVAGVGAAEVRGSHDQLGRMVANLLTNAVRHASARVNVTLESLGERAVLRVDDDGAGVEPEHRGLIFDRFVRLDEARSRDKGGSGLGLALVREIVEAHGGTITIDDSPLGGARFEVRLPIAEQRVLGQ